MRRGALDRYYCCVLDLCWIWMWVGIVKGMFLTLFPFLFGSQSDIVKDKLRFQLYLLVYLESVSSIYNKPSYISVRGCIVKLFLE